MGLVRNWFVKKTLGKYGVGRGPRSIELAIVTTTMTAACLMRRSLVSWTSKRLESVSME